MELDVLYLADPRFPGGTGTSLRYELRACRKAGLRAGIIPLKSPLFPRNRVLNQALFREIEATGTIIVPRDERPKARLALLYHHSLLDTDVACAGGFDADACYLVVHETTRDRLGRHLFETKNWKMLAADWFGHELRLLPVSDIVRTDLEVQGFSKALHRQNWTNLIDVADFPLRTPSRPKRHLVIGRHTRPAANKWPSPEVALKCYPPSPDYSFRLLGIARSYLEQFDPIPWNWQVLPFSNQPVSGFLRGLDVYSYFHSDAGIESFGYTVLEALATGLPCVVPHYLEETFPGACFHCAPEEAPEIYDRLRASPSMMEEASQKARAFAQDQHGLERYREKFDAVSDAPARPRPLDTGRRVGKQAPVVLAVTSNGIGLGHLSRQIAIARAMGPRVNTVFFSLSEAIEIARSMGYLAEFRPFHRRLELDIETWNAYFMSELFEALQLYEPSLVLFDGNVPYSGFLGALDAYGRCPSAWIRRGLWRNPQPQTEGSELSFDAILEPGELCRPMDPGYSNNSPDRVARFDPVVMTQPQNLFSQATARKMLDLPEGKTLCLVQLGSEANFDMTVPRQVLMDFLDRHPDIIAVDVKSPLHIGDRKDFHERLILRKAYPLSLYLKAFDFAVCAAGYNTFHENIAAALPTLFVPNDNPSMDLQESRAEYAARSGWGLTCRAYDPYAIGEKLSLLSDPGLREKLSAACARNRDCWNGARQIARQLRLIARLPDNPADDFQETSAWEAVSLSTAAGKE